MGHRFTKEEKLDCNKIISSGSLCAVQQVANYLKENSQTIGMFRYTGNEKKCLKILTCIRRGDTDLQHQLEDACLESAAALVQFLLALRCPLIPTQVQELILADNRNVPVQTIACDALGLLKQDLSGRHLVLLRVLLDLFYTVTRNCRNNCETIGCNLPIVFLPIFFRLQVADLRRWKEIASIFDEMISAAPDWFGGREESHVTDVAAPSIHTFDVVIDGDEVNLDLARRHGLLEVFVDDDGADNDMIADVGQDNFRRQRRLQFVGEPMAAEERLLRRVVGILAATPILQQAQ